MRIIHSFPWKWNPIYLFAFGQRWLRFATRIPLSDIMNTFRHNYYSIRLVQTHSSREQRPLVAKMVFQFQWFAVRTMTKSKYARSARSARIFPVVPSPSLPALFCSHTPTMATCCIFSCSEIQLSNRDSIVILLFHQLFVRLSPHLTIVYSKCTVDCE